jgi:hypothetical protein
VVGLGVRAKFNLAKRFYITIIYLFVSDIPVTKTRSGKIHLISETRTSFCTSAEGKRTERFSEKSLNLENSLKSEVRLPSSKETLQLLR